MGISVAGKVTVRESVALMKWCRLCLAMHDGALRIAICAGLRSVAIFSARGGSEQWHACGSSHAVLQETVPCGSCTLRNCLGYVKECVAIIPLVAAIEVCRKVLEPGRPTQLQFPQTFPAREWANGGCE